MIKKVGRVAAVMGAALWMGAGCVSTTGSSAYREANQREDNALAQEKMRRLEGDMESLTMQVSQLRQDIQRMQATSARASDAQITGLRSTLTGVERRIDDLEARRETDRKAMETSLSKSVAQLINEATGGNAGRSRSAGSTASSGYGFEHIVQSGETLSRIAQAYNTTVNSIIKANNIKNPDALIIGATLFIPE